MEDYEVKYNKGKMLNLKKRDSLVKYMFDDLVKRGHSEGDALEIVFNSEVVGDATMISKYDRELEDTGTLYKENDRVREVGTNARGVVVEVDETLTNPYGVLFEDVDDDKGLWWCNHTMIRKDTESTYDVDKFIRKIKRRK